MPRRLLLLLLLLLLGACGSFLKRRGTPRSELWLCVQNETTGYGNVIARAGLIRFDVMPGREECKRITDEPTVTLSAVTTSGGIAGPLAFRTTLQTGGARCWRWRLSNSRASAVDLTPCDDEYGARLGAPAASARLAAVRPAPPRPSAPPRPVPPARATAG